MRGSITKATIVVFAILSWNALAADAADRVELAGTAAVDLANVSMAVADDASIRGPDDLVAMIERGARTGTEPPAASEAPVWYAARLFNRTRQAEWTMVLRHAFFGRVDVWLYDGTALVSHGAAGIGIGRPEARPQFALGYEFPITLPSAATRTIVIRLEPIFSLGADPMLAPAERAHGESARRRIIFPLLLGAYLAIAAFHAILYLRFGGPANLLFAGTVIAIVADWFLWLGGMHELGLVTTVAASIQLSNATWFAATFFMVVFCLSFFASGRHARLSYAALLGSFALFVAAYVATAEPDWQLREINAFLLISAAIIIANAVAAIGRRLPGAWLALVAYAIELANELSTYVSVTFPGLDRFDEWMKSNLGDFDVETLLSQIVMIALFSWALWERVRATLREHDAAIRAERARTVQLAHDIRSPLHAMQSAVGALMARAPVGFADPGQVEAMQSSVRSVIGVLDDIVDLARTGQAGAGRRGPVDLRQLVADAAAVARAEIGDRPVTLRVDVADEVPARIAGDAVALRRVLGNLLSNAARATGVGAIAIELSLLPAPEARVRFAVSDTGSGMSERRLKELFGPPPHGVRGSRGFGLEVAAQLVEASGGLLCAASRLGAGTTVWFDIPAPAAAEASSRPRSEDGPAIGGLRLLLVEDDALTAAATRAVLAADGHEVTLARTAAEAVDLASGLAADLVLMDLGLDLQSGLEAIRQIRRLDDPARAAVPIVVVTGDRDAAEAARGSVRAILVKPFDAAALRRAIADALGREAIAEAAGRATRGFLPDLAAMLPPASLHALLETGRAQIDGEIGALARAAAAGRWPDAQRCAHRLAGSAGVLGLGRLVAAARAAEAAAASGDRRALGSAVRRQIGGGRGAGRARPLDDADRRRLRRAGLTSGRAPGRLADLKRSDPRHHRRFAVIDAGRDARRLYKFLFERPRRHILRHFIHFYLSVLATKHNINLKRLVLRERKQQIISEKIQPLVTIL